MTEPIQISPKYFKEYWTGDTRDGKVQNIDGYNYFIFLRSCEISKAYELYERDDGEVIVTPLPEMKGVNWLKDLGYNDCSTLIEIELAEFEYIEELFLALKNKS